MDDLLIAYLISWPELLQKNIGFTLSEEKNILKYRLIKKLIVIIFVLRFRLKTI